MSHLDFVFVIVETCAAQREPEHEQREQRTKGERVQRNVYVYCARRTWMILQQTLRKTQSFRWCISSKTSPRTHACMHARTHLQRVLKRLFFLDAPMAVGVHKQAVCHTAVLLSRRGNVCCLFALFRAQRGGAHTRASSTRTCTNDSAIWPLVDELRTANVPAFLPASSCSACTLVMLCRRISARILDNNSESARYTQRTVQSATVGQSTVDRWQCCDQFQDARCVMYNKIVTSFEIMIESLSSPAFANFVSESSGDDNVLESVTATRTTTTATTTTTTTASITASTIATARRAVSRWWQRVSRVWRDQQLWASRVDDAGRATLRAMLRASDDADDADEMALLLAQCGVAVDADVASTRATFDSALRDAFVWLVATTLASLVLLFALLAAAVAALSRFDDGRTPTSTQQHNEFRDTLAFGALATLVVVPWALGWRRLYETRRRWHATLDVVVSAVVDVAALEQVVLRALRTTQECELLLRGYRM